MGGVVIAVSGLMAVVAVLWLVYAAALWSIELLGDLKDGRKVGWAIVAIVLFWPSALVLVPLLLLAHRSHTRNRASTPS